MFASKNPCMCDYFEVARQPGSQRCSGSLLYNKYSRINFTNSPASGAGNASESSLLSQVGKLARSGVRIDQCVSVFLAVEIPVLVC
jgi:hypothetical protein